MRITPLDIRKQEFRRVMRGLDPEEVHAFLSTVGDEYESILNDNKALRERLLELDDKVQEYRTLEKTLRDTLLTAERVTVEAKDNARREANLIIKEAQIEAEKALRGIKSEAMRLRQDVQQLRGQRESYLGRMKVIAESLLKFIESVDKDFHTEDDAYRATLPGAGQKGDEAMLADPPASSGDLFTRREREGGRRDATAREASRSHEPARDLPVEPGESPWSDDGTQPQQRAVSPGAHQEFRYQSSQAEPMPPGRAAPAQPYGGRRAPEQTTRQGEAGAAGIKSIDDIVERMAKGQREILSGDGAEPPADRHRAAHDAERFEAMLPPLVTDNTPERNERIPVGGAWERVPEVAATVEQSDSQDPNAQQAPRRMPLRRSEEITSEWTLERLRRDLESRPSVDSDDDL
jgi:cell division initiation protein